MREPRWVMSITVEGSGAAGIRVAQKLSREVAKLTGAAVYDQQAGRVLVDGKLRRPQRVDDDEGSLQVKFGWYSLVSQVKDLPPLPLHWLDLATSLLPEAAPVRYGDLEPPRYRLDRDGTEPLARLWHSPDGWRPSVYADLARPALLASWGQQPVGAGDFMMWERASLLVEPEAVRDPFWQAAMRRFFLAVAVERRCVYALSQPDHTSPYEPHARVLTPGGRWYGLHPRPQWWCWYGPPYADVVADRLPEAAYERHGSGIFVVTGSGPFDVDGAGPDPLADLRAAPSSRERRGHHDPNLLPAQVVPAGLM
ncbi:MAG TPA: hypothetical protein PLQ54_07410 [Armatimonadota bacterium]|nr:hypothetical protein [Armatimonadota bacterium]